MVNGAFRPVVTPLGARHPVTAGLAGANVGGSAPSWGSWYRAIATEDVHGQVLMTGPGTAPLLVLSHVDQGRVALLLSDRSGCGAAGIRAAARRPNFCAAWPIGRWASGPREDRLTARITGKTLRVERRTVRAPPRSTPPSRPPMPQSRRWR
ncbi:MAG: hypothetical protein WDN04_07050 [Rhodospirillales bacterium]